MGVSKYCFGEGIVVGSIFSRVFILFNDRNFIYSWF